MRRRWWTGLRQQQHSQFQHSFRVAGACTITHAGTCALAGGGIISEHGGIFTHTYGTHTPTHTHTHAHTHIHTHIHIHIHARTYTHIWVQRATVGTKGVASLPSGAHQADTHTHSHVNMPNTYMPPPSCVHADDGGATGDVLGTGGGAGEWDMDAAGGHWTLRAGLEGWVRVTRAVPHGVMSPCVDACQAGTRWVGQQVSGGRHLGGHQTSWCQG